MDADEKKARGISHRLLLCAWKDCMQVQTTKYCAECFGRLRAARNRPQRAPSSRRDGKGRR